jgi:hypothetical protein
MSKFTLLEFGSMTQDCITLVVCEEKKKCIQKMLFDGLAVIVSTLVVILASAKIRVKKQEGVLSFQPKNIAFSIWSLIFSILIVSGVRLLDENNHNIASVFVMLANISSMSWLLYQTSTFSPLFLYVGATCAFIALTQLKDTLSIIGPSLLFSWLTVASALSTSYQYKKNKGTDLNKYIVLIPVAILNTCASIFVTYKSSYVSGLVIAFVLLWAAAFSNSIENALLFSIPAILQISFIIGNKSSCVSEQSQQSIS